LGEVAPPQAAQPPRRRGWGQPHRDGEEDDGTTPYQGQFVHASSDIWVRHTNDHSLVHENPLGGQENTVYVRVANLSCDTDA